MAKNRFDGLAGAFKGEQPTEPEAQNEAPLESLPVNPSQPKSPRKAGKRSRAGYTQTGAYIPEDLYNDVKRKLVGQPYDYSDLVAKLLKAWVEAED